MLRLPWPSVTRGDAALVVAVGRWREDALAETYRRHAGAAFALARRAPQRRELAEEVVVGRRP
jgi:RNA polymerase sigma-70 factor (ECF subfamily)